MKPQPILIIQNLLKVIPPLLQVPTITLQRKVRTNRAKAPSQAKHSPEDRQNVDRRGIDRFREYQVQQQRQNDAIQAADH
jgi:hypothetical protein